MENGGYRFAGLPRGDYQVSVDQPNRGNCEVLSRREPRLYVDRSAGQQAPSTHVDFGQQASGPEIVMVEAAPHRVSGRVLADACPLAPAWHVSMENHYPQVNTLDGTFSMCEGVPHGENRVVTWCKRLYQPVLTRAVRHPVLVLVAAVAVLGGSLVLALGLGSEFLPELNEGSVWVNLTLPPGISVTEAVRECAKVRSILKKFPEVRTVVSKAGRPEDGTDPKQINMSEFLVDIYPQDQWKRKITSRQRLCLQSGPEPVTLRRKMSGYLRTP